LTNKQHRKRRWTERYKYGRFDLNYCWIKYKNNT